MGELSRRPDVADQPPAAEPSGRPERGRAAHPDVQAELARLIGQKPRLAEMRKQPEPDARLEEAQAKIAELETRLEERDTKLDAANTKIAELEDRLDSAKSGFDEKVGALETRFEALVARQERRVADLESRVSTQTDRSRVDAQGLDRPAEEGPEQGRTADPVLDEQARSKRADEPPSRRRGPSDAAPGFMVSGAGTALSEVASLVPQRRTARP